MPRAGLDLWHLWHCPACGILRPSVTRLGAFEILFRDPGHQRTQALAHFFDWMRFPVLEKAFVFGASRLVLGNPTLGELARLDVLERLLHFLLHRGVHNLWADGNITPFGRLRNGEAHSGDARLIHEVDNEFQLVKTLEISHLWLVPRFNQHLEAVPNQRSQAAAKHRLFAEEVSF